jgi:hypothetical protein
VPAHSKKECRVILPVEIVVSPDLDVARLFRVGIVEFGEPIINRGMGDIDLVFVKGNVRAEPA